jgi:hypothetical protein
MPAGKEKKRKKAKISRQLSDKYIKTEEPAGEKSSVGDYFVGRMEEGL